MKAYFNGQYNTLKYNEQIRSGITAMVDRAYNAKLLTNEQTKTCNQSQHPFEHVAGGLRGKQSVPSCWLEHGLPDDCHRLGSVGRQPLFLS